MHACQLFRDYTKKGVYVCVDSLATLQHATKGHYMPSLFCSVIVAAVAYALHHGCLYSLCAPPLHPQIPVQCIL